MDIDIEDAIATDDSCVRKYWGHGHISFVEFEKAVKEYAKAEHEKDIFVNADHVEYKYYRKVPLKNNIVCEFQFVESKKGKGVISSARKT